MNAASFQPGPVSPGELVTLFGSGIGPAALTGPQLAADGTVANLLAGTRVLFDGVASPLIYVSANQVSAVVPFGVAGKTSTSLQVEYKGVASNAVNLQVSPSGPAVFTGNNSGKGLVAAVNEDGSINGEANPAPRNSVIVFYATGGGQSDPAGIDGKPATDVFPKLTLPVSATIGGKDAEVLYGGAAPGFVAGVLQFNVRVPEDAVSVLGLAQIVVTLGSASSQSGLTVAVQ